MHWHSVHISTKSWCGWHGYYAWYAVSLWVAHIPENSLNSQESHSKCFHWQKINPISGYENLPSCSWEYWRQLTAGKMTFLSFHGTVATFYSRGEQKQNCLSQISVGLCVYQKLFKSVYFWLNYSRKNRVAILRRGVFFYEFTRSFVSLIACFYNDLGICTVETSEKCLQADNYT